MTPDPATLTVRFEPLPPEREAAYWHAAELLFEIARRFQKETPEDENPCTTNM